MMIEQLQALLPRLQRIAWALCRSRSVAGDLVQAASARAIAHGEGRSSYERFDLWVFQVLRKLWLDDRRRSAFERLVDSIDTLDEKDLVAGEPANVVIPTFGPRDVLEEIRYLPLAQREVLVLVCVENLTCQEAADVLGAPVDTVRSRLLRARLYISAMFPPAS